MHKSVCVLLGALLAASLSSAAELTPVETRWVQGLWPVVRFARGSGLPLDVIVQPQPARGAAPLALGFVDGRCKLVLSMRGNPEAEATLERIDADLVDAALELMAAHELGHCRRYLDGKWLRLPAGFSADDAAGLEPELRAAYQAMRAVRREEGYADLAGLAWVRQHHPDQYARLHAWLVAERSRDLVPGSQHDTRAWLGLAGDADALADGSPSALARLWSIGIGIGTDD